MAEILPGLFLYPNVITAEVEEKIVRWLDTEGKWSNALARRTQHYGYEYGYSSKGVTPTIPITGPLLEVAGWLKSQGTIDPTQCIVNEYTRNQGIGAHTDSKVFGPVIVSLSLCGATNMIFKRGTVEQKEICIPPRTLLVMNGPARSEWTHEIPKRTMIYHDDGTSMKKSDGYRRISLTYRTIA